MGRNSKVLIVCSLFLLAVCLPASANSNFNFSNVKLTGNSGSNISGSFSFDPNTHTFSNMSMTFSQGAFDGVKAWMSQGQGLFIKGQGYLYTWLGTKNGNLIWCSILFNPSNGQFREWGGISNGYQQGGFDYVSVPEGGAELSYLMLSGLAIFGGILISGRKRRLAHS